MRRTLALSVVLISLGIVSCSSGYSEAEIEKNDIAASEQHSSRSYEPPVETYTDIPEPNRWICYWDPTMNENWHDDVLCSNGVDQIRPELLPEWEFVTHDDIMGAAFEYELELNRQFQPKSWRDFASSR